MSEQLQLRRGTAAQVAAFTGAPGEVVVDTTNNRLVAQDGATAGGYPAAKLSEVVTNTRTAVADAAYSALPSDRTIAYTSLTTARIVTLPAASAFPTGTRLIVLDESGACSATNTITLSRAGSDTIDGATSAVISSAYGYLALQSDGSGKWTIVDQAASNLVAVGIGTAADSGNPLSVYAASALFNSGGDIRVKLNKAAAANTASFLFQDAFSGRAEIGLTGDDDFHFKVSPDGSTWHDAIDIAGSGDVTIGATLGVNGNLSMISSASYWPQMQAINQAGDSSGPYMLFRKGRTGGTTTQNGDSLGTVIFQAYDTSNAVFNGPYLTAYATGPAGAGYIPSALGFVTMNSGGAHQAMVVDQDGVVRIGSGSAGVSLTVAAGIGLASFTVATLPAAGTAGRVAYASDGRMFNGAGTLEGAGAGTGGLVVDDGAAWKIAGTNVTVSA